MKKKNKVTFALDIGTRSIVGLLIENSEKGVVIKEIVSKEHINRAMLDGQIHNIPQVSLLVKEIKKELEQSSGLKLKKVAVAAAGRSLKTIKETSYIMLNSQQAIKKEDVLSLELKCAQKAQVSLLKQNAKEGNNEYYCVGYSVTRYYLDDSEIGSLISQRGNKAGLEIVAAFLPKVVVDSLQAVLIDSGLELANITLEPIAAINAILPASMRKLNLALVDIGAGTSDIAISSNSAITAYGMVPVAGDEITEAICEKFLLDFTDGEIVKRQLNQNMESSITFSDILGIEHIEMGSEIVNSISDDIKILAEKISTEILNLNTNTPQAVILIGGGSLTPYLTDYIAEKLCLSKQRVAVQKASSVKDIIDLPSEFQGPEIITPLGIGITAMRYVTLGFIPVQVNGNKVNLINLGKNTVLNALLAAGVHTGQVIGKPGRGLTIEVNGKIKTFPGSIGQKAIIKLNNVEVGLDTLVQPQDKINYIPAQNGKPGRGWLRDIINSFNWIKINGQLKELPLEICVNGTCKPLDTELNEGDKVYFREFNQIGELLEYWNMVEFKKIYTFVLIINGIKKELTIYPFEIIRNGYVLSIFDKILSNDEITLLAKEKRMITVAEVIKSHVEPEDNANMLIRVNEQEIKLSNIDFEININGLKGNLSDLIQDNDILEINYKHNKQPILIDIFSKINFPTTPPPGHTNLEIKLNGEEAEYTTPLEEGDHIVLTWK